MSKAHQPLKVQTPFRPYWIDITDRTGQNNSCQVLFGNEMIYIYIYIYIYISKCIITMIMRAIPSGRTPVQIRYVHLKCIQPISEENNGRVRVKTD